MAPLRTDDHLSAPTVDVCIVGAGVIGLSLARTLARDNPGKDILLLDQHDRIGAETSSRNSEVIHAGLYYPPGSLKATLCIRGRELLYAYCEQHQIAHRRIGKLIVAGQQDAAALEQIYQRAQQNGVTSLQHLDRAALKQREPHVQADLALWSPDTGIVDSHGLMQQLLHDAQTAGVTLALRSTLLQAEPGNCGGFSLLIQSGPDTMHLHSRLLINCAGLHAGALAQRIAGLKACHIPAIQFIKGNYFSLSGRSPFSHLVYPVPDPLQRGLGIHATLDMMGQCRFGPDIEALTATAPDKLDYSVDAARRTAFVQAISRYYPAIDVQRLHPAYAGIRPRLQTQDGSAADFLIQEPASHGVAGLWQLFGIESPGLTSSLALAEHLSTRIRDYANL